jgi:archaetidylinositol phosphate synthase
MRSFDEISHEGGPDFTQKRPLVEENETMSAKPITEPDFAQVAEYNGQPARQTADLTFRPAVRVHGSFLAAAEKRLLVWLAERMPGWVNSDHLTALGAAGMTLAGLALAISRWYPSTLLAANFFLCVNWFGDSLDGTLARVRDQQRPRYGFYVDHVVDVLGAVILLAGYGASGAMHPLVAAALLVAFLMVMAEVMMATYCLGNFQMSFWRLGPTELRIFLMIGNVALLWHPSALGIGLFDWGGAIGAVGLLVTFCVNATRHTRQLYREESSFRVLPN